MLEYGKPDLEEELSQLVGDAAANAVGDFARGVKRWADGARDTMRQNVAEYLTEESGAAPSRYEADRFRSDVNRLRDDVARLEARIDRMERDR